MTVRHEFTFENFAFHVTILVEVMGLDGMKSILVGRWAVGVVWERLLNTCERE